MDSCGQEESKNRFFGKYRGKVENNIDPMMLGRVQISCPAVLESGSLAWAMPCSPYAGSGVGFFAVPPMGANIWVEFEGGDLDYPIYSGCFWGTGEVPAMPATPTMKVFKTDSITITISDIPGAGGLTVEAEPPAVAMPLKMVFDSNGIEITDAPASIKITPSKIEISHAPATMSVSPSGIEMETAPSSVKISPSAVEAVSTPAELKIAASAVEIKNTPSEAKIGGSGIELKNGAGSIKISPATVNINNGALEIM